MNFVHEESTHAHPSRFPWMIRVMHSNEKRHNGLQVYWRSGPGRDGRHVIRVRASALGGDIDAAERVANKLL